MPYLYNTAEDQQAMLDAIGVDSIEALFEMVPADFRLQGELDLPPAQGEMELEQHLTKLADKNTHSATSFLGGGCYDHFIPAVVDTVASRSEFYTSYTPYQAEVSQGNLQAMFEYQTLMTRLTGLEVSNSSLYDGGSAAAEGVLMALSVARGRNQVVLPDSVHPEYCQTITTYLENLDVEIITLPTPGGLVDPASLAEVVGDQTACVLLQQPNFFGGVEEADLVSQIVHDAGTLLIAAFDPISLGLLKRPGDWAAGGADIAVAEGQSLGSPMAYGGPFLGIIVCREKLVRRMPGRIVGKTDDRRENACYTLTLQTREQHIRRDKATSNVCSNQGLFALRATVYLALLGPQGLKETANLCLQKSRYLADRLCEQSRFSLAFAGPTFKEFVIRDADNAVRPLLDDLAKQGILAGVPLGDWYPDLEDCFLVAVTEKRTKEELDAYIDACSKTSQSTEELLATPAGCV